MMGKFPKSQTDVGDIHAPVEDTEVPLSFKILVVLMIFILGGFAVMIATIVSGLP